MSHRLIVTNCSTSVDAIRAAGLSGDCCAWHDVLSDGPVPGSMTEADLSRVRAEFIAGRGWGEMDEVHRWFLERDARLEAAPNFPEVILWFEHDLYDQLQLIQILSRLADGRSNVSIVQQRRFIGEAAIEDLRTDFRTREPVSLAQYATANMAWAAFRSSTPATVEALVSSGRTESLPFLAGAIRRWCETFPDPDRGLSRTERRTLELVADGMERPVDLYRRTSDEEEAAFRGDASYWELLRELATGSRPLLSTWSGAALNGMASLNLRLRLTRDGEAVLRGHLDRIEADGIDTWRGGVHLTGPRHWRWSGAGFEKREMAEA